MVRKSHLIAVVGAFLIAVVVVGCAGLRSEASKQEEQGHTEATTEQTHSSGAASSEEARCRQRTFKLDGVLTTTNDVPGCPKGGLLSGTGKGDWLLAKKGDDEVHGLGGSDDIEGGLGNDVIYGGPGVDFMGGDEGDDVLYGGEGSGIDAEFIMGGKGEDVLYGGDGNDFLDGRDERGKDVQRDELYCGAGRDVYDAGKLDYVDSSCEKKGKFVMRIDCISENSHYRTLGE